MCIFRCMHSSLVCNPPRQFTTLPATIPPSDPSQIIPISSSITNRVLYTNQCIATFLSVVQEVHTKLRHTNKINRMNRSGQPVALNGTVSPFYLSRQGSSLPGGSGLFIDNLYEKCIILVHDSPFLRWFSPFI